MCCLIVFDKKKKIKKKLILGMFLFWTGQEVNPMTTRGQDVLQIKTHPLSEHASASAYHLTESVSASNGPLMRCLISQNPLAPPSSI